jgi:predicted ferric reductase
MIGIAFAAGLLFAHFLTLTGVVGFVASIGVWWTASIAVLAIVSALRALFASSSVDFRLSSLGWSAIPAAS